MPYYYYGFYPWSGLGVLWGLLWFFLVIFVIVALVRGGRRWRRYRDWLPEKTALDILKERYAKGELAREQFEQMKKDIGE
ncbi:MAG: SHOCT domain-containing protein [Patescibacteria group bacterium]|nr:SHOCT domain-containing protein [Patescibacteria group bacterium]